MYAGLGAILRAGAFPGLGAVSGAVLGPGTQVSGPVAGAIRIITPCLLSLGISRAGSNLFSGNVADSVAIGIHDTLSVPGSCGGITLSHSVRSAQQQQNHN
jgi:hypothetical protein